MAEKNKTFILLALASRSLLIVSIIFCLTTMAVHAQGPYTDGAVQWRISGGTLTIEPHVDYRNVRGSNQYATKTVSSSSAVEMREYIYQNPLWYEHRDKITAVVIKNGILSIGSNAFRGLTKVTSVSIPSSVETIGDNAFRNCISLRSISISASIRRIASNAFDGCEKLTSITANASNLNYCSVNGVLYSKDKKRVIANPTGKKEDALVMNAVSLSEGDVTIKARAFQNNTNLTTITIPNSVTTIEAYAFERCTNLETVIFGNSVVTISDYAFAACTNLKSITISNSVTTIGEGAFYGCSSLTEVILGSSVTTIAEGTFGKCSNLATINLPNTITSIGNVAFRDCESLTSITIPNSVKNMYGSPFFNCNNLKTVNFNAVACSTDMADVLFKDCNNLTVVNIGNEVQIIPNFAFTSCSGLTSITFGNSVTTIGIGAFAGCSSLTSIDIPNSVTTIEMNAFEGCTSLISITIPKFVTAIGGDVFSRCSNLETVNFNAINCKTMGTEDNSVFVGCNKLTVINFGNEVQTIPPFAFRNLNGLKSITIPNSVINIGGMAFKNCKNITEITCHAIVPPQFRIRVPKTREEAYHAYESYAQRTRQDDYNRENQNVHYFKLEKLITNFTGQDLYLYTDETKIVEVKNTFEGLGKKESQIQGVPILKIFAQEKIDCILFVPKKSVKAYKKAEGWKSFKEIKPIE